MRKQRVILIIVLIIALLIPSFVFLKNKLAQKIKAVLVHKMETALHRHVEIESLVVASNSIAVENLTVFREDDASRPHLTVTRASAAFSMMSILKTRSLMPLIRIKDMAFHLEDDPSITNLSINGDFTVSINLTRGLTKAFLPPAVSNIKFLDINLSSLAASISGLKGDILIKGDMLEIPELRFSYNDIPCELTLHSKKINSGGFQVVSQLTSSLVNASCEADVSPELIKISKLNGSFGQSGFDFMGEMKGLKSSSELSLYGNAKLNLSDLGRVSQKAEEAVQGMKLNGVIDSAIFVKGSASTSPSQWEIGVKSESARLSILDFKIDNFSSDFRLKDGKLESSLIRAYPYDGVLIAQLKINPFVKGTPYAVGLRIGDINVNKLSQDTALKNRDIYGLLQGQIELSGLADDLNSMKGRGAIAISDANLGPMPLLTPLLGSVYGYMQTLIPNLKKIDITSASCDFQIAKNALFTDNLRLSGETLTINARGYIDFNKNLNFEVENELREVSQEGASDLEKNIMAIITGVGKFLGKAYLTGTLQNPKWEFQYFNSSNPLGGDIQKVMEKIKGLF